MKLYVTVTSPYVRIVRCVIAEKGLVDRIEVIPSQTRVPDSPYYLINPTGRVPVLALEDGTLLEDSGLICAWLDHHFGTPQFDPPPGDEGWEHRRVEALVRGFIDGLSVWLRERGRAEDQRSPITIAHETARAARTIDVLEEMTDHPVLAGPPGMPHFILITALQMEERRIKDFRWRDGHPKLSAWADRIAEHPSVRDTLPAAKPI